MNIRIQDRRNNHDINFYD